MSKRQTVGDLRKLIADLPDDARYQPDWANGPPGDHDPAVTVVGFEVRGVGSDLYLGVLVDIAYLDDVECEGDDETAQRLAIELQHVGLGVLDLASKYDDAASIGADTTLTDYLLSLYESGEDWDDIEKTVNELIGEKTSDD